jgi:hypothetical protein
MLAVTSYSSDNVAACRNRIAADIAAYEAARPSAALDPVFYGMMLMALDRWFVHRRRSIEGEDGNALNEVRVLSDSIVGHGGMLVIDKGIALRPETSVLGIQPGATIMIDKDGFHRLSEAFLGEIEARFCSS